MASDPVRIGVVGAAGRMGTELLRLIEEDPDLALAAAIVENDDQEIGKAIAACDVIVDFSTPAGLAGALSAALAARRPFVSGTTGLSHEHVELVREAARQIPVMIEANFSVGVHMLSRLVELGARSLPDFDVEILEAHHRHKVDAPSGTALLLLGAIEAARPDSQAVFERKGQVGPRSNEHVGVQAVRGGSIVGEHTVMLCGEGERLELIHRAQDRAIFARGALRAAKWIVQQSQPGAYQIKHMLFGVPSGFGGGEA